MAVYVIERKVGDHIGHGMVDGKIMTEMVVENLQVRL